MSSLGTSFECEWMKGKRLTAIRSLRSNESMPNSLHARCSLVILARAVTLSVRPAKIATCRESLDTPCLRNLSIAAQCSTSPFHWVTWLHILFVVAQVVMHSSARAEGRAKWDEENQTRLAEAEHQR